MISAQRCSVSFSKVKRKCFSCVCNTFAQSWLSSFRSDQATILEVPLHPDSERECPLLAQSGHAATEFQCPLLGVKRTLVGDVAMSAFDPKQTIWIRLMVAITPGESHCSSSSTFRMAIVRDMHEYMQQLCPCCLSQARLNNLLPKRPRSRHGWHLLGALHQDGIADHVGQPRSRLGVTLSSWRPVP